MLNWKKTILKDDDPISKALKTLNSFSCVLVTNYNNELVGTVTDRDIRKRLLQSKSIDGIISEVMNIKPTSIISPITDKNIQELKKKNLFKVYPLVDEKNHIVGVYTNDDIQNFISDNLVVIMAGGVGSRLGELTHNCPKPLLKVGDKTILEIIINSFTQYNFNNFIISVNYFAEMIINYFQTGENFNASIDYVQELKPLGTAGSLGLIKKPSKPFFLINGDILTKVNYLEMMKFHNDNKSLITVGVREYKTTIPYGVFNLMNNEIHDLVEKPVKSSFINAGIYIINPEVLDLIPSNEFTNITDIIKKLLIKKYVTAFPIYEYWTDIGEIDTLNRAKLDYDKNFIK